MIKAKKLNLCFFYQAIFTCLIFLALPLLAQEKTLEVEIDKLSVGARQGFFYHQAELSLAEGNTKKARHYLAKIINSPLLTNNSLAKNIYQKMSLPEKKWLVGELQKNGFIDKKVSDLCPFFNINNRKDRADFLLILLNEHSFSTKNRRKMLFELYVSLAETNTEQQMAKFKGFLPMKKSLSAADLIKRMEILILFGQNNLACETFSFAHLHFKRLTKSEQCELTYQNAKASRQLKQYKEAKKQFQEIAQSCPSHIALKARYMELSLASMMSEEQSLAKFDLFVSDYPTHGFSDDVLMFKAALLNSLGKDTEQLAIYHRLINEYPNGDMIDKALFNLAFLYAKMKKLPLALKYLNQLKSISSKDSLAHAQASFWSARLLLFNDPLRRESIKRPMIAQVKKSLLDLVNSDNPTVYSWLALDLLHFIGEELPKKYLINEQKKPSYQSISLSGELLTIFQMIEAGYHTQAISLLNEYQLEELDLPSILHLAYFYELLNRPELAYQKLIKCHENIKEAIKKVEQQSYLRISYPTVFADEIAQAVTRFDLSPYLLLAIVRQESAFLANAVSWAGARGLAQLMFSSAKDKAKSVGITKLEAGDLLNPKINLLLGSSLLSGYLKKFDHLSYALAAYNAGPTAVSNWRKKNPDMAIDAFIEEIPFKETRHYVMNVLGAAFFYARQKSLKDLSNIKL